MTLKKLFFFFSAVLLGMLVVNTFLFVMIQHSHSRLTVSYLHRQKSLNLMYDLRQEADRLSSLVHDYIATGEPRFRSYYYDILAIRDGEKLRPDTMSPSYWDQVIADEFPHQISESGSSHSLAQQMALLEFAEAEFQGLKQITAISAEMKQTEEAAFAAIQGLYDPELKAFVAEGRQRLDSAGKTLYSPEYRQAKARLAVAIERMTSLVDQRTAQQLYLAQRYVQGWIVAILFSLALTFFLVLAVSRFLRQCLLAPMIELHDTAIHLAAGRYDARSGAASKLKEINDLSMTLNSMAEAIELDIARREVIQHDLEEARMRAEAATATKTMFLANMSHEIRTPMNAIIGMTHLALNTILTSQQRDYIDKAHTAARTLLGILNDILDVSKMESGKLRLESTPFELEQVVTNALFMVHNRALEKEIELLLEVEEDDEAARMPIGDPLRLGQVLTNLLANAVKFTESGHVRLRVEREFLPQDRVSLKFCVEDTGIGMSEVQVARLFQDFAQADESTTRHYGGTGLGLAISQRLIGLMGSRITVASTPGRGSVFQFCVEFPLSSDETSRAHVTIDPRHLRVLLVDDYPVAREVLFSLLASMAFGVVAQASNGQEALEKMRTAEIAGAPYDVLLLDWVMPGMNGATVLQESRAQGLTLPAHVVIVSAHDDGCIWQEAQPLGATHLLAKPVMPGALRRCLARPGEPRGAKAIVRGVDDGALTGLSVLLVEDNQINQQIAQEMLRKWGMNVDVTGNGQEALDCLHAHPSDYYALVFMDLQMPVMDGFEAARRIRAEACYADLPIVALTAHAMAEERERCLKAGMNDHLAKPFDFRELRDAVVNYCRRSRRDVPTPMPAEGSQTGHMELPCPARLDHAAALALMNNDRALYRHLLERFAQDYRESLQKLHASLTAERMEDAMRIAHTLKGLAGSLGIIGLAEPAAQVELATRNRDGDVKAQLAAMEKILQPLLRELESFFAVTAPTSEMRVDAGSQEEAQKVLRRFAQLLDSGDGESVELWSTQRHLIVSGFSLSQAKSIGRAMDRYDFNAALDEVNKVLQQLDSPYHG